MTKRIVLAVLSALTLGGCFQDPVSHAWYICEDKQVLIVAFTGGKQVSVEIAGRKYIIPRIESTSGAKYESPETGTIFWSKGMDVNFVESKDAPVLKCERNDEKPG